MMFNKEKCKVLPLGRDWFVLGSPSWVGKQLGRKGPGGPDGLQPEPEPAKCPCDKRDSGGLGCVRQNTSSRSREGILPLCSALLRPHLEHRARFCLPRTGGTWTDWGEPSEGTGASLL